MIFKFIFLNTFSSALLMLSLFHIVPNVHSKARLMTNSRSLFETCFCDFCNEIRKGNKVKTFKLPTKKSISKRTKSEKSKRTIMIYMAADNNLRPFAARNIQQMANIGSNEHITILVHLDIRLTGNKKVTRRYLIEKEQVFHVEPLNPLTQQMDSGNPSTLISFCEWTIKNYPASEDYDLILWNHGTGILEPAHYKIINPMDLFVFNPLTNHFELDRSIGFMEALDYMNTMRGVCWDDTTGNYLSNRKLEVALDTICTKFLKGKKFGIIGFDACLMSMAEIASFIKKYAHTMVASEEVELGMGWKYDEVLSPFSQQSLQTIPFACHIVQAYNKTYQSITNDYTLSAINLDNFGLLEKNIDYISQLLIQGLSKQKNIFLQIIKESKSKFACTHFDEPTYIDLYHFYKNIWNKVNTDTNINLSLKSPLLAALQEGMNVITHLVVENKCGKNLKNAHGISIYFPERNIHSSYQEAAFLNANAWSSLLSLYIFG